MSKSDLQNNPAYQLTQLVAQYGKHFNAGVPMDVLQGPMSTLELNEVLRKAIADGKPVPGWAGRALTSLVLPPQEPHE